MGVKNFKPSLRHKVQVGHKIFNIMDDPKIALIAPKVECKWKSGAPPRFDKHMAKKLKDLDDGT